MAGSRPGKWSVGLWLAGLAVLAVALHWGWVRAWWVYPGLSEDQRVENFNDALWRVPGAAWPLVSTGAE